MLSSISNAVRGNRGGLLGAAVASLMVAGLAAPAEASTIVIPTNFGNGADAEVRESESFSNPDGRARGHEEELATRVFVNNNSPFPTGNERNSVMFLRFDISQLTLQDIENATDAYVRLHVNTTSWNQSRSVSPDTGVRAGFSMMALRPGASGQDWQEGNDSTAGDMAYHTAPGLVYDANMRTKDYYGPDLQFMTATPAPDVGVGSLPVGYALDFNHNVDNPEDDRILQFLADAISAGNTTVTFLIGATQDGSPLLSGSSITNFNYVFASKEVQALRSQLSGVGPDNGPSPWSGASNANGEFSPKLVIVPEPASLTLLGLGGLGLLRRRRA